MLNENERSVFKYSLNFCFEKDFANKHDYHLINKLLIIKSDNSMTFKDDVTKIDSDIQNDVHSIIYKNFQNN